MRLYKIFVCINFHQIFNGSWSRLGWAGVLLCKKITQDAHDEGALPINCYKNKRKILHMVNWVGEASLFMFPFNDFIDNCDLDANANKATKRHFDSSVDFPTKIVIKSHAERMSCWFIKNLWEKDSFSCCTLDIELNQKIISWMKIDCNSVAFRSIGNAYFMISLQNPWAPSV